MKKAHFLLAATLIFVIFHSHAQYLVTVYLEQMEPYVGKELTVRAVETATGKEVGRRIMKVTSGNSGFDLYVLLHGRSYTIDFVVDVNLSGDYDAPPIDHAWRRNIINAVDHMTMTFIPDSNFTDTGLPDAFPYETYDAVWGGKWLNQTFGSTDSIMAGFQLECDSVFSFLTTKGVFGNPNTVTFEYEGLRPSDNNSGEDTIYYQPGDPWTGEVFIFQDQLHGEITSTGLTLIFNGTVGAKQILSLYEVKIGATGIANGYFYLRELQINDSTDQMIIELVDNSEVSCHGKSDGLLSTSTLGGTPPYTYLWSNDETSAEINNLTAGDYSVTVTDSLGCMVEMLYSVSQPPQIVTTWFTDQVSCAGLCDGSIDLIMIGGVPPYSFIWSNGLSTEDAFDLCTGTYTPTITDAVGCMASAPITVFEPDSLIIHLVEVTDATTGQSDGSIVVEASGGAPPYLYSINGGPFQASNIFTGLPPGQYTPTVRDANGCLIEIEVIVNELTAIREPKANYRFYPNPASSFINIESDVPISVEILDIHGNIFMWSRKGSYHYISVTNLPSGIHMMRISDDKGRKTEKFITINPN